MSLSSQDAVSHILAIPGHLGDGRCGVLGCQRAWEMLKKEAREIFWLTYIQLTSWEDLTRMWNFWREKRSPNIYIFFASVLALGSIPIFCAEQHPRGMNDWSDQACLYLFSRLSASHHFSLSLEEGKKVNEVPRWAVPDDTRCDRHAMTKYSPGKVPRKSKTEITFSAFGHSKKDVPFFRITVFIPITVLLLTKEIPKNCNSRGSL